MNSLFGSWGGRKTNVQMKKLLFMAAFALPAVAFTACSDDDEIPPAYSGVGEDTTSLDYFYREHCYGFKVKDTASLRVMGVNYNVTSYLSGTRNGRLWIAGFDYDSKEQISEFVDSKPLELEYRIDLGYGDSMDVTINHTYVKYLIDDSPNIIAVVRGDSLPIPSSDYIKPYVCLFTFYTPESSKTYFSQTVGYSGSFSFIKWFNGSYLIEGLNIGDPYDHETSSCMTQSGDTVFTTTEFDYDGFRDIDDKYFVDYKEYIGISYNEDYHFTYYDHYIRVARYNLDGSDAWSDDIRIPGVDMEDLRYSVTKEEVSDTVWKFAIDYVSYKGKKGTYSFEIDINTGEIADAS